MPAETPDMSMTAALGTATSKRLSVVSTELIKMYASAGSQVSSDQPQARNFRTILLKVDVLACVPLGASLSSTADAKLSGPPLSCQNCTTSHVFPNDKTSGQFVSFVYHVRMENDLLVFHQFAADLHLLTKHLCC